jgi:hypothetical protein
MQVKELREKIANLPGEMPVYFVGGEGLCSVLHRFEIDLRGDVSQSLELRSYFQAHGPALTDLRLDQAKLTVDQAVADHRALKGSGFESAAELLTAYRDLQAKGAE